MRDAEYPTRADWDRAYYGTFPPPPPHWRRDEALWQEMEAILSTPPPRPAGRADAEGAAVGTP